MMRGLAIVSARVPDLDRHALKDDSGVLEIQTAFRQRLRPLGGIEGHARRLL
jgi:hypothetical protein